MKMSNRNENIDLNQRNINLESERLEIKEDSAKFEIGKRETSISAQYHKQEINQNAIITKNAIVMMWIGIVVIIAAFILSSLNYIKEPDILSFSGVFIDIFSATILFMYEKSTNSKKQYFDELTEEERMNKLLKIIENEEDKEIRMKLVEAFVNPKKKIDKK